MSKAKTDGERRHLLLHLSIIIAAVLVAYGRVLGAGFLAWDDAEYVLANGDIRSFSPAHIGAWFSRFYVGNYHPLTMFSYAIDYGIGGVKPFIYHFTNILLHAANACILYAFVSKLQAQKTVALAAALLFALHPMQTEAVSWVAERKTVLSGTFSLLALLQYQAWVRRPVAGRAVLLLLFCIMAFLSKATAVVLPVLFIATDLWLERDMRDRIVWLEKLPVILLAGIVGYVAIAAQGSGHFMQQAAAYGPGERLIYAGYGYAQYLLRFIWPVGLSAMYPHPQTVEIVQMAGFAVAAGMAVLFFISLRKRWYMISGGILFFTAGVLPVLQLIPFGEALTADRYMYIPCIGIIYPAVHSMAQVLRRRQAAKRFMYMAAIPVAVLTGLTWVRNGVWLSDMNFFKALLDRFPESGVAQYSMGGLYMKQGDLAMAEEHLNRAVMLEPANAKAWYNKGLMHARQGRAGEALEAFDKSIAINDYTKAHFSRAMLHLSTGHPELALADADAVLRVQPYNARAYYIKGASEEYTGHLSAAMASYSTAIKTDAHEPLFFMRRAATLCKLKRYDAAQADISNAIAMAPQMGECYYWKAMINAGRGQPPCADLRMALQYGYRNAAAALQEQCGD